MSEIGDKIQEKCMAFADRMIRLNDYLLEQASSRMSEGRNTFHLPSKSSSILHLHRFYICKKNAVLLIIY